MKMETKTYQAAQTDLYRKTSCRYCTSPLPEPFLDLGQTPLANSFLKKEELSQKEFVCPLRLAWCSRCWLVQLCDAVPAEKMFRNYLYVSSTTETFKKHFAEYAQKAKAKLLNASAPLLAVDIGSNDGLLLSCYQKEGMTAVGVEPAVNLSQEANRKGIATLNDYFGARAVEKILKDYGPADMVSGNNVFAHIDDIHDVCRNVAKLLKPQGIFVIEFPYLAVMLEKMVFDMIYHEHLSYIAVTPLRYLFHQFHLEIFAIETVSSHGGSLRVFIQKKGAGRPVSSKVDAMLHEESNKGYGSPEVYRQFAERVYGVKRGLVAFVDQIKSQKKSISGYGAPAKGNTLINFCGFNAHQIDYIVDDNPLKQGLFSPGAKIPVVPAAYRSQHPTDYVILFAWNFAEEIIRKLQLLREKGVQFMIPLPEPKIV